MVPSAHALRIGIAAPPKCVGRGREEKMGRNVEAMLGDEPFITAPNFRRITLITQARAWIKERFLRSSADFFAERVGFAVSRLSASTRETYVRYPWGEENNLVLATR